jgi:tetratricopeptide (TPR) repeat protein
VTRGSTLYAEGRYVDAASVFESAERQLASDSPSEQATYGLYRGMTLLALGDWRGAERWLTSARRLTMEDAEVLGPGEQKLLGDGEHLVARARERAANRSRATSSQVSVATVELGAVPAEGQTATP